MKKSVAEQFGVSKKRVTEIAAIVKDLISEDCKLTEVCKKIYYNNKLSVNESIVAIFTLGMQVQRDSEIRPLIAS